MRGERAKEIALEIQKIGGQVFFPPDGFRSLRRVWNGDSWDTRIDTDVILSKEIDARWLREHDDLAGLRIDRLDMFPNSIDADAVKRLLDAHSIRSMGVVFMSDVDAVAERLG